MCPERMKRAKQLRSSAPYWSLRDHEEKRERLPARSAVQNKMAAECKAAKVDAKIVERRASIEMIDDERAYITNTGGELRQRFQYIIPHMRVVANAGADTQARTLEHAQQGGF